MAKKRWRDLSPRTRKIILLTGAVDGTLKAVALADLKRRDADEVNGSKRTWAIALTLLNTAGVLPAVYLARGRRPAA